MITLETKVIDSQGREREVVYHPDNDTVSVGFFRWFVDSIFMSSSNRLYLDFGAGLCVEGMDKVREELRRIRK